MERLVGWTLDVYDDPKDGLVLWLLGEDENRYRLHQPFPITFYAQGPSPTLRALWKYLSALPYPINLSRQTKEDLFSGAVDLLAAQVINLSDFRRVFNSAYRAFPDLEYHNVDIPISVRFAARYGVFPLILCEVMADETGRIHDIAPIESRWDIETTNLPLRVLTIEPNVDPSHRAPTHLQVGFEGKTYTLKMNPVRSLLIGLRVMFKRFDPDLVHTYWGDGWLFPYLLELSEKHHIHFNPNRDKSRAVLQRGEGSYHTYGRVVYRGRQAHLYGRYHIDAMNAAMYKDHGYAGVFEQARVSGLPVQTAARRSPGAGITAMQFVTALQRGLLIPYKKQQAEKPKSVLGLIRADRGGMVYKPTVGIHENVAQMDFDSMYPGIMVAFNVSPETTTVESENAEIVPELGIPVDQTRRGLVPETLEPLLHKRLKIKEMLLRLTRHDCRRASLEARSSALKWLLVVSFGYLGYKRFRWGRIEAHESVTAYSREGLLRAKEAAESLGFEVLHMYVDGIWVKKEGATEPVDYEPLLLDIHARTKLPLSLDGVYRWIVFLPSRLDERVPVPNRWFGVWRDGRIECRGIELRRHDTPSFIKDAQIAVLNLMAQAPDVKSLPDKLPEIVELLKRYVLYLRGGRVELRDLVVRQHVSRAFQEYRIPSRAARAARQLEVMMGTTLRPGQVVGFIHTIGKPDVHAWGLLENVNPASINTDEYVKLLLRAASTVLWPLGVDEDLLYLWVIGNAGYIRPPGIVPPYNGHRQPLDAALAIWKNKVSSPL